MIYVSFSFFTAQSSFHSIHYYIVHLDGLLSWRAMAGNFQPQLSSQVFSSLSSQPAGEPETAAGHSKNINKLSQAEVSSISGCFEGRGRPVGGTATDSCGVSLIMVPLTDYRNGKIVNCISLKNNN